MQSAAKTKSAPPQPRQKPNAPSIPDLSHSVCDDVSRAVERFALEAARKGYPPQVTVHVIAQGMGAVLAELALQALDAANAMARADPPPYPLRHRRRDGRAALRALQAIERAAGHVYIREAHRQLVGRLRHRKPDGPASDGRPVRYDVAVRTVRPPRLPDSAAARPAGQCPPGSHQRSDAACVALAASRVQTQSVGTVAESLARHL